MALQPYEQGHLDYYCGLYSIANALKLIDKKMGGKESTILFRNTLRFLEKRIKISSVATRGILPSELGVILMKVVSHDYNITVTRPFLRTKKPRINQLLDKISDFLEDGSKRAVIASISGNRDELDHWSVIKRFTKKEIHFFDSTTMKKLHRRKCTTAIPTTKKPYQIDPAEIFFLQQDTTKMKGEGRTNVSAKNKR